MERKYFMVYDQQIAGLLMCKRYMLKTARPDKYDNTKNIFFFDNSDKIEKDFEIMKNNKKIAEEYLGTLK